MSIEEVNYNLEQKRRYLLDKVKLKKKLFGNLSPSYYDRRYLEVSPRKCHSSIELNTLWKCSFERDDLEYIDATESTIVHEADISRYESVFEPWDDTVVSTGEVIEEKKEDEDDSGIFDLASITSETAHESVVYKCRIRREKHGTFPVFCLYLQHAPKKTTLLLAGKKCMISKSGSYTISTDPDNFNRKSPSFMGKLKSNLLGTKFTIYDNGRNSAKEQILEVGAVIYEKNILGLKGPRKFTVILPSVDGFGNREPFYTKTTPSILDSFRANQSNRLIKYQNLSPIWNNVQQSYFMNFDGRVKRASVKNFKLVRNDGEESLVMQFGKVSRDSFSMDFSYPLSALQAFGIALSSFDYKLACE